LLMPGGMNEECIRALALIYVGTSTVLGPGCSQSHGAELEDAGVESSCRERGGACQTPDLPCTPASTFAGYDLCGDVDNNACCVPSAPPDAGPPDIDSADAGTPDGGPTSLCRALCEHSCGYAFGAGASCLLTCERRVVDCSSPEREALEGCLASCDYFEPCVRDVACTAPDGDHAGIRCGDDVCTVGSEVCRFPIWEPEDVPRCIPTPPGGGSEAFFLSCDGPEDCPADEGCGLVFGGAANWAMCGSRGLCHSDADCGELDCRDSADLPPGFSLCSSG